MLVAAALVSRRALALDHQGFQLGPEAPSRFEALGVDLADVAERARGSGRPLARTCLDWSERQYHIAGALGAGLVSGLLELQWIERLPASRAVRVTGTGRRGLLRELDVRIC